MTSPALTPADYLKKILTARVYDVAVESSLEPATRIAHRKHKRRTRRIAQSRAKLEYRSGPPAQNHFVCRL